MNNMDYLEQFYKKHNLSGKVRVRFSSKDISDENMTDIEFENGDTVNINDIIFDIVSDFPNDVVEQWLVVKKDNDISLMDWFQTKGNYKPVFDNSSVEEYKKEMTEIFDDVKNKIETIFHSYQDSGDSDEDDESGDE